YMGTDELRTTYVSKEIASVGNIYFKSNDNNKYNTKIFVKNGFLINQDKTIYPFGFTVNSLTLVPVLTLISNSVFIFNAYALICYLLTFLVIFNIFNKLKMNNFY